MAPVERSKFGAPMLELDIVRKQMYCIEKSRPTCDIVGTSWRLPQWFGARGILLPSPSLRPWVRRLISGCISCLYSNQNIETTNMLRFSNIATQCGIRRKRPSLLDLITEKLSVSTFILPGPSTSRALVWCTSCQNQKVVSRGLYVCAGGFAFVQGGAWHSNLTKIH